jgi:hypothetical protein
MPRTGSSHHPSLQQLRTITAASIASASNIELQLALRFAKVIVLSARRTHLGLAQT